ncbi:MAG: efflux RND transporter periplasmic adaptor subunit [Arenimonas sp.]
MSTPARAVRPSPRHWLVPLLVVAALAAVAWWLLSHRGEDAAGAYRTEPVERGEIRTAISATGTLSATTTVDVGTQVSGTLQSVEVDFNDTVKAGQVIARLDPSTLQARLDQASAALASSRASVGEAQATAKNAEADYARKAALSAKQLIARTDADLSLAARDQARARIASANAQVRQQQAIVSSAQLDLEKSVIRSPVDGVVLERAVEPGQTVAASLQTPVLFKIAGDLSNMEIVLAIDEADIGQVREGQTARFTVDAFPERNFSGRVKQVRLAATNTANVITYPVVVEVENPGQVLLPGMTANAEIEISRKANVLSVPNAALRFRPVDESSAASGPPGMTPNRNPAAGASRAGAAATGMAESLAGIAATLKLDASQQAAFDAAQAKLRERSERMRAQATSSGGAQPAAGAGIAGVGGGRNQGGAQGGGRSGQGSGGDRAARQGERMKQNFADFHAALSPAQQQQRDAALAALTSGKRAPIYRLVGGKPEQLVVRVGASDGTRTELLGAELKEGEQVIVGSARPDAK